MSSLANQVEFLHKQYSLGNSHRFTSLLDCGLINNHDYFMVLQNRPGPTLKALLEAAPSAQLAPTSAAFIAIDLISTAELLASTGYVLRNFDAKQWKFDVKSRMFIRSSFFRNPFSSLPIEACVSRSTRPLRRTRSLAWMMFEKGKKIPSSNFVFKAPGTLKIKKVTKEEAATYDYIELVKPPPPPPGVHVDPFPRGFDLSVQK
ncbi:unnamed protein product [Caenorhabditis sp. 36 PRJEB53466]|nr:unnamed protein product [Caenorhabditis sp. 36 PRJEB53466]